LAASRIPLLNKRPLRVCYWDSEKRITGATKALLESYLQKLGGVDMVAINSLTDDDYTPCDLIILTGEHVPGEAFANWLSSIQSRLRREHQIWTPALILANTDFNDLDDIFPWAVKANWYFDVIHTDHLESLPIRVANLLRIHDHLHELNRYHERLAELETKLEQTNSSLAELKKQKVIET